MCRHVEAPRAAGLGGVAREELRLAELGDDVEELRELAGDPDDAHELLDLLAPIHEGEVRVGRIGPVIGTHGGPGVLGVSFWVK